jgi:hypothetical protein
LNSRPAESRRVAASSDSKCSRSTDTAWRSPSLRRMTTISFASTDHDQ